MALVKVGNSWVPQRTSQQRRDISNSIYQPNQLYQEPIQQQAAPVEPQAWQAAGQGILDQMAAMPVAPVAQAPGPVAPPVAAPQQIAPQQVSTNQSNPGTDLLMLLAQDLYGSTAGLRSDLIGRGEQFMGGDMDITGSPVWQAQKAAAEDLYGQANQDMLAQLPGGGALMEALAGNARDKALGLTQAAGNIAQDELNWVRDFSGVTAPSLATQGAGTAGGIQADLYGTAVNKATQDAALMAGQRANDMGLDATYRGQDVTGRGQDVTGRGQDVTSRGQDVGYNLGSGGLMAQLRGQDVTQSIGEAQIAAQQAMAEASAKGSAAGGLGTGLGMMIGGK